jgi:outer membrane protein OmpA-like peptidoglycan-associated protein
MRLTNRRFHYLLAGSLLSTLLVAGTAHGERPRAPGYATDSQGEIVRSGDGSCVRGSEWKPEMAVVVGCDGVVLKAPTKVGKGGATGRNVEFIIPASSMFAFDSAELTEQGKKDLDKYRDKIRPELAGAYAVVIIGHTDSKGDPIYNLELSKRRATAVRDFLIAGGAPPQLMRVVGMGEKEPIAENNTDEGRALNRRVEVLVYGEARGLDTMQFPSVAMFPPKSSVLTPEGKKLLETKRQEARASLSRAVYVEIIGHTDDVGEPKERQKLSELRALAVRDSLVQSGLDPGKITTVGVGSTDPIASNQTEQGRAQNRRVEVIVLGRMK